MGKELRARIVLDDNYSSQILKAAESTNNFKEQIKQAKAAMEAMRTAKVSVNVTEATRQINKSKEAINSIKKNVAVTIAARDEARESINRIKGQVRLLTSKPVSVIIKAKDMISGTIKSITDKLFGLKTLAAGIILGGTAKFAFDNTIGAGARLEQEQVAMNHFIGNNNKGKNAIEVQKMTDDFINQLRKNANETPFGTNEVLSAGRRSINIMGGDVGKSMELVKLAENMAALNPGKNVMDAMEALGDLKTGEFERMKEFGFKFSANQFKALVGKGKNDDLTDSEMTKAYESLVKDKLNPTFYGGADKLSKTAAGQWSTTTGNLESIFANIGKTFLPAINKALIPINAALDKVAQSKAFANLQKDLMGFADRGADKIVKFLDDLDKDPKKLDEYKNQFKQFIEDLKAGAEVAKDFAKAIGTIANVLRPLAKIVAEHPKMAIGAFLGYKGIKGGLSIFKTFKEMGKELTVLKGTLKNFKTGGKGLFGDIFKGAKGIGKGAFTGITTGIKGIGAAFKTLRGTLKGFSIIKPLQDAFKGFKNLGVMKELPKALSAAFSPLKTLFKNLGTVIKTFSSGAVKALRTFFVVIAANPVVAIIIVIIAIVILLYEAWTHNWGGIRDKTKECMDKVNSAIDSVKNTFNSAKSECTQFVADIKRSWEDLKEAFAHPIQAIVKFSQEGSSLAQTYNNDPTKRNALGTSYYGGGFTHINENGGEIIDLPKGSRIIPHDISKEMARNGGGVIINMNGTVIREDADIDKIATALAKKLKLAEMNM